MEKFFAFRSQIPSAHKKFCCCDCGASFHHMHLLTNHIQSVHVDDLDKETEMETATGQKEDEILGEVDPTRTGEVATLEKPFQCEHCDKCFGVRIPIFKRTLTYYDVITMMQNPK